MRHPKARLNRLSIGLNPVYSPQGGVLNDGEKFHDAERLRKIISSVTACEFSDSVIRTVRTRHNDGNLRVLNTESLQQLQAIKPVHLEVAENDAEI
jgi:hypothetical protein